MGNAELLERVNRAVQETKNDFANRARKMKKLLKEAEYCGDIYIVGRINLVLAHCYFDLGSRNKVLPYAVKAVDVFQKLKDRRMLARSYNLLGIAYLAQENYLRAIEYYNRAIEQIGRLKKPGIRKDVMQNNIAECYYLMGEYKQSIRLMHECLSVIQTKRPDDHVNAVIYAINLSDDYEGLGNCEKAIEILDSVQSHVEQLARDVLLWGYYARKCCVLYKLGRMEEAEKCADLTIESVNTGYDSYEFHRDFEKISKLEVSAGDFTRAQCFADILKKYADSNGHTIDLIISKRVQANICFSRGEQDHALLLYKELSGLYDRRVSELNAIKYASQKDAEAASREIANLMMKIRNSEERAERDPLSGLLNRAALIDVSNKFFEIAREKGTTLGAVFLDIDFFKEYNDTYGHAAGDDVIRLVSGICLKEETEQIKFFRYGGDEFFGIVLDHSDAMLENLALRIQEKIRSSGIEHIQNPNGRRLTVSAGVVNIEISHDESSVLDLIKHSDHALYRAKDHGKDAAFSFRALSDTEHEYRQIVPQS